jgi:hypothetical protein
MLKRLKQLFKKPDEAPPEIREVVEQALAEPAPGKRRKFTCRNRRCRKVLATDPRGPVPKCCGLRMTYSGRITVSA